MRTIGATLTLAWTHHRFQSRGRQVDGEWRLDALPSVVREVKGRAVLFDSGFAAWQYF